MDLNPKTTSHLDELETYVQKVIEGIHPLPSASNRQLRAAALDEVRLDRLFKAKKSIIR